MGLGKSLLPILVFLNLLVSCQKGNDIICIRELELPDEDVVMLDSTKTKLRLAIIGDSISSYKGSSPSDLEDYTGEKYPFYYPHGDVSHIDNMWWYKVAKALGVSDNNICNCSWSGSRVTGNSVSTTTASVGCSTKRIMDLSAKGFDPDFVFCYISCNDWASGVPLGNWSKMEGVPTEGIISTSTEAYALMITKIKEYYPSCLIICLTNLDDTKRDYSPGWPSNNRNGVSVDDWNRSLMELSRALGCISVDLQDCGITYNNVSKFTVDGGLHPNDAGMTLIANKVVQELETVLKKE